MKSVTIQSTTSYTKGWKTIGTIPAIAAKTQILRIHSNTYSEATGLLIINSQYADISSENTPTMLYFGSDLGSFAITGFRLTADSSSNSYNSTLYLEAYLNDVINNHNYTIEDITGNVSLYSEWVDSSRRHVYSEVVLNNRGGLHMSKPLGIASGGTGATTAEAARANLGAAAATDLAAYLPLAGGTVTGNTTFNSITTFEGDTHFRGDANGDEGGQIFFAKPPNNSAFAGDISMDIRENQIRWFSEHAGLIKIFTLDFDLVNSSGEAKIYHTKSIIGGDTDLIAGTSGLSLTSGFVYQVYE